MKHVIEQAVKDALATLGITESRFVVEYPADESHGDFATNAALVHAKELGQSPRAVAEALLPYLTTALPMVTSITIAGPGFINFTLTRQVFTDIVTTINQNPDAWGNHHAASGEFVLVEYTSPNLFKPLHIGNLVGNIVGESFTRLFERGGATVKRLNYPSDIGLTVAKGVWGLQHTGGDPRDITALGEAYRTGNAAYEDGSAKEAIDEINRALYAGTDATLNELRALGIATSKARLAELCTILGTHFDTEIYESEVSERGADIVRGALGSVFTESEGAIVFEGERVGLHTRVFITGKNLPTYEAKDVGHFTLKEAHYPHWTRSIIVTGNEQTEYFKVLFAALRELFTSARERALEHIPTGFLTLTTGKMSSRLGNVLTGESLLEELKAEARQRATVATDEVDDLSEVVAVAALKYQILRHSTGSDIIFDKERALSFEGDSGPYLQYTHARIGSVLEKAAAIGVTPSTAMPPSNTYPVERLLRAFPEVLETALLERAPHQVVTYLTALAGSFNSFYATERIADATDEFAPYKAAVALAVATTLKQGLWVLGIPAPERM